MVKYCVFEGCGTFTNSEAKDYSKFEVLSTTKEGNSIYILYRDVDTGYLTVDRVILEKNLFGVLFASTPERVLTVEKPFKFEVLDFKVYNGEIYILGLDQDNMYVNVNNEVVFLDKKDRNNNDITMTIDTESGALHVLANSFWYTISLNNLNNKVEKNLTLEYLNHCLHITNNIVPVSMVHDSNKLYIVRYMNGNLYLDYYTPDTGIRFASFLAENVTDLDPKIISINEKYYLKVRIGYALNLIEINPLAVGVETNIIPSTNLSTNKVKEVSLTGIEKSGNKYLVVYDGFHLKILDKYGPSVNVETKGFDIVYGLEDKVILVSKEKHSIDVEVQAVYI